MNPESGPCFLNGSQVPHHPHNQIYSDVMDTTSNGGAGGSDTMQLGSFLGNLSILKEKVNEVQSLVNLFLSHENNQAEVEDPASIALASMGTLIQEIVVTASSMMFNCQQMSLCLPQSDNTNGNNNNNNDNNNRHHAHQQPIDSGISLTGVEGQNVKPQISDHGLTQLSSNRGARTNNLGFLGERSLFNWYADNSTFGNNNNDNNNNSGISSSSKMTITISTRAPERQRKAEVATTSSSPQGYDIVELDAAALLAKYTHYCQVCGKGFKRDANLRMHMRAHGDEYKSSAALSNPLKNKINGDESSIKAVPRKYSCPHEGCRWNKNHAKFQPLKSMICVKNHYKRSHCPKMYVCKRCNQKQFSVLSDLRTHEKHCGDVKWQCSCGTTFSRKDKLMGHVSLFVGHTPLVSPLGHSSSKLDNVQILQNSL